MWRRPGPCFEAVQIAPVLPRAPLRREQRPHDVFVQQQPVRPIFVRAMEFGPQPEQPQHPPRPPAPHADEMTTRSGAELRLLVTAPPRRRSPTAEMRPDGAAFQPRRRARRAGSKRRCEGIHRSAGRTRGIQGIGCCRNTTYFSDGLHPDPASAAGITRPGDSAAADAQEVEAASEYGAAPRSRHFCSRRPVSGDDRRTVPPTSRRKPGPGRWQFR